jgi:aspartate/methionine/tyrosine aminotransferase
VNIIAVNTHTLLETLTTAIISTLETAYSAAPQPWRVKALVLTNPHNPLAQCYPPEILRSCLSFCHERNLHFISDEVYALSTFESSTSLPPFVSALSFLDNFPETDVEKRHREKVIINPSRVHVVWSMSKDFGCSGLRMVRN